MGPKNTLLLLFATIHFFGFGQPAWELVTPTPQENHINDVVTIPGTNKVIAVADGASIMISEDQGETWQISINPGGLTNESNLKHVYFYNSSLGFAAGYHWNYTTRAHVYYTLKTTDGGLSWEEVTNFPGKGNINVNGFYFVNGQTGFIISGSGRLLKSVDSGESWYDLETGVTFTLKAIDFCNDSTGYIVGNATEMLKTTDYGNTWSIVDFISPITDYGLADIIFVDNTIGYVANTNGTILKTSNAGLSWGVVFENQYIKALAIDFYDENHGMAICFKSPLNSCIISTNDGWLTWDECALPIFQDLSYSVCCLDAANFLFCGMYGMIYKSSDGGNAWGQKFERTFWGDIFQVQYLDENTIFCLVSNRLDYSNKASHLHKSIDGGETFDQIASISVYEQYDETPAAFHFVDQDIGFITYYDNEDLLTVLRTDDDGDTWTEITSGNYDGKPFAMQFYDGQNGLITGNHFILKTDDGGYTWQEVYYNNWDAFYILDIHFFNADEILVAGGGVYTSTILMTSHDAGQTWEDMPIGVYGPIDDIEVINNSVYLACDDNVILKSPDGGNTWQYTQVISPNSIDFHAINFPTEDIGYALGSGPFETMVKTTDGGSTWNVIHTGVSAGLNAVHFFDDLSGVVYGEKGIVLKTYTGGTTSIGEHDPVERVKHFLVYPNPFTENFKVNYQLPSNTNKCQVEILDQNGKSVFRCSVQNPTGIIDIPGNNLKPGIYIIVFKTEKVCIEAQKIVRLP